MSGFKENLKLAFRGELSVEAAEVQAIADPSALTLQDVTEAREERIELSEALHEVQTNDSAQAMDVSEKVVTAVGNAAKAAETMPPQAAEAYVAAANMNIQTAESVLETSIPKLATTDDGSVDTVSLESLTEWFGTAIKAFSAAASKTGGRIALGFVRLNSSADGLHKRTNRIREKVRSRKGEGGKDIKLGNAARLLVVGGGYSQAPVHDLDNFAKVSRELTDVVMEYHKRCDRVVKESLVNSISQKSLPHDLFAGIQTDDLFKRLEHAISNQNGPLLGNVKYVRDEDRLGRLLAFHLAEDDNVRGNDIQRYGNPIQSLDTETILRYCGELDALIDGQIKLLQRVTDATKTSYASVGIAIRKLTDLDAGNEEDADFELDSEINTADLLRLESQLVSEIGRICDRLGRLQADMLARINAVLTLVEESVFQD